jgi:hypothetical protein
MFAFTGASADFPGQLNDVIIMPPLSSESEE